MKGINNRTGKSFFINARFLNQPITGVQRYSLELLCELDDIIAPMQASALCPAPLQDKPNFKNIAIDIGPSLEGNLWEQVYLPWKSRNSLLFSPANIGPYFKNKQIITIHDMSVFVFPMAYTPIFRFKYRLVFKRLAKTAAHILTVSEFSKQEIQKYLKVPPEKITVTYEGWEHIERVDEDLNILDKLEIRDKPYFLVVGSLSHHKNLNVILDANALIDKKDFLIVIIGAHNPKVFKQVKTRRMNNLINAGYVNDNELKALYKRAVGLIFPSLYEGFGLPLVEAMACGCPVICSDIPSSHEICANAALYFDPSSANDLASKMKIILEQSNQAKKINDKGFDRLQLFSWKKTAASTKEVLMNILDQA